MIIRFDCSKDYELNHLLSILENKNTNWQEEDRDYLFNEIKKNCKYMECFFKLENNTYIPKVILSVDNNNSIYNLKGRGLDNIIEEKYIYNAINMVSNIENIDVNEMKLYYKYFNNLKKMYSIENKTNSKEKINSEEIIFLYITQKKSELSQYFNNPLYEEIISKRNIKDDFNHITSKVEKIKFASLYGEEYPVLICMDSNLTKNIIKLNSFLFKYVDEKRDDYFEIAALAIKLSPQNIEFVNPNYSRYVDLAEIAIESNPFAIEYIDESKYKVVRAQTRTFMNKMSEEDAVLKEFLDEFDEYIKKSEENTKKLTKRSKFD